ncbi:MAG: hypothetical protein ACC656_08810 [Candidatus Heimdallarchaeota archaeon]
MSKTELDEEELVVLALINTGLTRTESEIIAADMTDDEIASLLNDGEITSSDVEKKKDGFINALILAGIAPSIANMISQALDDDEEVVRLLLANQTPLTFMTQQDSKVDDKICLPKQGEVWAKEDSKRPRIPLSLHENCRCFWQDPITGRNLGQF